MFRPPRCTALVSLPAPPDLDPPGALERLRDAGAPWLLESALPMPGIGRYSFAGADPYLILRCRGQRRRDRVPPRGVRGARRRNVSRARPRARGAARAAAGRAARASPSCRSAAGRSACSATSSRSSSTSTASHGADDLALPDAVWLFVDALVGFDHERGRAEILGLGFAHEPAAARERAERAARGLAQRLARPASAPRARGIAPGAARRRIPSSTSPPIAKPSRRSPRRSPRASSIRRVSPIASTAPFAGDPWQLYRALRRRDPAPFAAYLELPEVAVAGSSPERFLRVDAVRARREPADQGHGAARRRLPREDARAARALATLREGPRREPHDRRPRAQ